MPTMKKVIARKDLERRVKELGAEISRDYEGRKLLVIGILNGAFIFMADLVRRIDLPLEIDFIRVASYGKQSCSSGRLTLTKDLELELAGRDLLLVEDIVDTGQTIACLRQMLQARGPASIRLCALIDKKERRQVPVQVDYAGFELAAGFLVGYGLDFAEEHRHYPEVYQLKV